MNLALTLDYELWGDGTGSVFDEIIYPTDRFLALCDEFAIKATIFFEVVEYWKIKEEFNSGNSMGYAKDPALAMEDQIIRACRAGHDIQLHFHPQWLNAYFDAGKWQVEKSCWKLYQVPLVSSKEFTLGLSELINKGKKTLEKILKPVNPRYECNIFRAGGYNIEPSKHIVSALKSNGFKMDSSVFPGGYAHDELSEYDYRSVKVDDSYWYCGENQYLRRALLPLVSLSCRFMRL